ncbi:cyanobactin maturation PatA/PatG family protease [Bradyrhizobium japonicum]
MAHGPEQGEPGTHATQHSTVDAPNTAPMSQVSSVYGDALQDSRGHGCTCSPGEPCTCGASAPQKALSFGTIDIGFRTAAERDSLAYHMGGDPHDLPKFLQYLDAHPWDAASIQWILKSEAIPIYVILPVGPFARDAYQRLREFLSEQLTSKAERVAIAGYVTGSTQLMTGQIVPFLIPEQRCMYNWNTEALIEAVCGERDESPKKSDRDNFEKKVQAVRNFLARMFGELRGAGTEPADRARIAATINAANTRAVFEDALKEDLQLDMIDAMPSPLGRDYWDVRMVFFDPRRQFERARREYRFSFDLSQACPVPIGVVRSWDVSSMR